MSPGDVVAFYRLYAARCIRIAQDLELDGKLILLDMAQAWLRLAEQAEKNSETALVYETPDRSRR